MGLGDRFPAAVEGTLGLIREAPTRFPVKHREPDFSIRRSLVDGFPYGVFFIWNEVARARRRPAVRSARATRLGKLFGASPEFWLNLQRNVDLWDAARGLRREIAHIDPLQVA